MKRIGWIGFGNMAQAVAKGWLRSGAVQGADMIASARDTEKLKEVASSLGIQAAGSNEEAARTADLVIVAVKPDKIEQVLPPLREAIQDKPLLSVAAGWNSARFCDLLGEDTRSLSVMPNLPVEVGEGIVLCEKAHTLLPKEHETVLALLSHLGYVDTPEGAEGAAAGVLAGCGPAFASMMIEALADGAVKHGLSRKNAYRLAASMLAGTARLQQETGRHPGQIKDAVCSPGGTSIRGVGALEEKGLRHALMAALDEILSTS